MMRRWGAEEWLAFGWAVAVLAFAVGCLICAALGIHAPWTSR